MSHTDNFTLFLLADAVRALLPAPALRRVQVPFVVNGKHKDFKGWAQKLFDGNYYVSFDDGEKYIYNESSLVFCDALPLGVLESDVVHRKRRQPYDSYCTLCQQPAHRGICDPNLIATKSRLRTKHK